MILRDMNWENMIADMVWWSTFWNALFFLLALVATALAIWALNRTSRAYPSPERDAEDGQPVIETALVSD